MAEPDRSSAEHSTTGAYDVVRAPRKDTTGGYSGCGIKRGAQRPPTGLVHGGKTMRPCGARREHGGQHEHEDGQAAEGDRRPPSFRSGAGSATGTTPTRSGRSAASAIRKPGEDHCEEECNARGHTICVVCDEMSRQNRHVSRRSRATRGQTSSGSASASRKARRSSGPSAASRWRSRPSPPSMTEEISPANWVAKMSVI